MKLKATLPKSLDENGLIPLAKAFNKDPYSQHIIIAVVDCPKTELDYEAGIKTPFARIRRVEMVLEGDSGAAERLMRRALEERSGRDTLPLDFEEAFDRPDSDL